MGYQLWHYSINIRLVNSNLKEQALIRGLSVNDKNAIETIYSDHYGVIQNLILNNNGSEEDAKDIFQEALIVLYEKSKSAEFELNCQVKTYLYSVSKRLWLKRLQKNSRYEMQSNGFEETVYVEDDIGMHEKRNNEFGMMEFAMTHIGEPCKSILEAYYIRKQNMQEIAAHFGYTNSDNAKNQKYKCLVRLRKLFFAQYKNGNK
ncbi:sigma-70 family RNA polymerase sigma factor [Agriterribacter sp.]|mgnify:FL=1|uniref:RNA polymerase sigma factor n=1 Tax=Agriterribacter sp. TaxID=2821509 RepID=UPI002CC8B94C|nr:sigma-70 family RNA polymerase sigma factor [Agriterribacter sp.]HRO47616.1 sigma-70 family RNA polymerase sigma factor [Agriterribacter sp.]